MLTTWAPPRPKVISSISRYRDKNGPNTLDHPCLLFFIFEHGIAFLRFFKLWSVATSDGVEQNFENFSNQKKKKKVCLKLCDFRWLENPQDEIKRRRRNKNFCFYWLLKFDFNGVKLWDFMSTDITSTDIGHIVYESYIDVGQKEPCDNWQLSKWNVSCLFHGGLSIFPEHWD